MSVLIDLFSFGSAKITLFYGSSIAQCIQPKMNDQLEFNFVLAESRSIENKCSFFICI